MRKTILITGASAGLGRGMAHEFARRGRDLALCARRLDELTALKEELLAAHPAIRVAVRALDVNEHERVFDVFRAFADELGGLDRVIVNAGLGKGQPIGTGNFFRANKPTAETNFVAALAQCEAALEHFRARNAGHLVVVSSMSAVRGMRGNVTTYAATKAGLAALAEGIRSDVMGTPIRVTTLFPGFIRTEMNARVKNVPFIVDTDVGVRAMVRAIEKERVRASIPAWPWAPLGFLMRRLPLSVVRKLS